MSNSQLSEIIVDGMTCSNCANTVKRRLEKEGLHDVSVDFASGEVVFTNTTSMPMDYVAHAIEDLGYRVVSTNTNKKKHDSLQ
jgi:Cu+-exporting ATPase